MAGRALLAVSLICVAMIHAEQTTNMNGVNIERIEVQGKDCTYTVKSGDTLSGIGAHLRIAWKDLAKYNHITNVNLIRAGQVLHYPCPKPPSPPSPPVMPPTPPTPPPTPPTTPPVKPPVDPPVMPPVDPPIMPPVDPPVMPPVDPPVMPPVDPPVMPPIEPHVEPTPPPAPTPTPKPPKPVKTCAKYKLLRQCDSKWKSTRLGTSKDTICSDGCAVTSVSMALTAAGINTTPATLNSWLNKHGGFTHGDWIIWSAINNYGKLKLVSSGHLSLKQLTKYVKDCYPVVVNVRHGTHYVLVTSHHKNDVFNVNDPAFSVTQYSYSDMSQWLVYSAIKVTVPATVKTDHYSGKDYEPDSGDDENSEGTSNNDDDDGDDDNDDDNDDNDETAEPGNDDDDTAQAVTVNLAAHSHAATLPLHQQARASREANTSNGHHPRHGHPNRAKHNKHNP